MASRSTARADPAGDLRAVVRILTAALALLFALPVHGLFRLFGSDAIPPRFLGLIGRILGADIERVGSRPADGLIVANHVGWIDILVLGGATGTVFVSKAEVRDWPLVGWLASLNRTIFVARGERAGVAGQVRALRAALGAARPVTIFPEGTTGDGTGLLPFKPALFEGVSPPPAPILVRPVYVDYGAATRAVAWPADANARDAAWALLSRRGRFVARVHMLAPFDPAEHGDRKAVAAEARRRILSAASSRRASGGDIAPL